MTASASLHRRLGFWDSVAINVGVIIGVGIFRTPGSIAQHLDSSALILLAWLLGALIALVGGLCYAELASVLPHTGGNYVYLREAYGRPMGFIFGWVEFTIMRAGSIAGVAYIFANYLQNFIPWAEDYEKIMTIAAIWFFTGINILGLHVGTTVQNILTSLKLLSILIMAAVIFMLKGITLPSPESFQISQASWLGIAPALIPILWTYGGWHQSTFMAGEFKDTKRDLPLSIMIGIAIVAGIYILINAAYLQVFSPSQMAVTKTIASNIFSQFYGNTGKIMVTIAVLISAGGALNSTILTGARIPFAVAVDYPSLSWAAKIDRRFQTPLRSLVLNAVWSSVLVFWGNFDQLLFFFAFANWLFFALTGYSVFLLRKKKLSSESYAMFGYPWVPVLFILASLAMCIIAIYAAPRESLFGALLTLSSIPAYWFFRKSRNFSQT